MLARIALCLIVLLLTCSVSAGELNELCTTEINSKEKSERVFNANITGIGIVTACGLTHWDYFSRSPHSTSEGWFGNASDDGGADKLGHLYTSYVAAHGLSALYESWCFTKHDAAIYGALSSFAVLGYMELGDSFSDYGFSREDFWMNALGSVAGYCLYENTDLARKIDIRWQDGFHPTGSDFTTDYENSTYLLAVKFNGFEATRSSFLKHLELHIGYYARGFYDPVINKERNLYIGLGINLTDWFRRKGYRKTAVLFNYMQLPGTYLAAEKDRNQ